MRTIALILVGVVLALVLVTAMDGADKRPSNSMRATARTTCTGLLVIGACNADQKQSQTLPAPEDKPDALGLIVVGVIGISLIGLAVFWSSNQGH